MVMVPATHQYLNTHWFTNIYAGDIKYKHYMKIFVGHKDFSPSLLRLEGETLILATNVQISIKGPVPSYVMPSLLKMSYDCTFRGGFGPFVIGGKPFAGDISNVTFLVEQRDTDILMTLPGAQLIGYVCSVVPKSCPNFIYQVYEGMAIEKPDRS